ncbi:MAG: heat-inducible transcriptional repressor HrcA [Gammaproteobacteria bacterium]|nr:heat-inducible transcriptional repressor HrcA [Gammaproteobacteria bacterium]
MVSNQDSNYSLNDRTQHLLKVLVESYISDGRPLGSRTLAKLSELDVSPATVRNVMADLEEFGFVESPHTSAGRVPTTKGYRLFVDTMLNVQPLTTDVVSQLVENLNPKQSVNGLVESASGLLSDLTSMAGVVTIPKHERAEFRQIEFLPLSDQRVLAILVMNRQEVQNRILHTDREYSESELLQAANYLNELCAGQDLVVARQRILDELDHVREHMNDLMRSAVEMGEKLFSESDAEKSDYVVVGQTNLMEYDELSDIEKLKGLFEAFGQKREFLSLLDSCIFAQGIQIFIGQESGYKVLDGCSVITSPYTVDKETLGVLAVVGPTRMSYERVIPIVDLTAKLLGEALNNQI